MLLLHNRTHKPNLSLSLSLSLMERARNNQSVIVDSRGNTVLHLAAKSTRRAELARVRVGEALLMQYELHRFKELERHVSAPLRDQRNYDGKTARVLFIEEHQHLKRKGEKWMSNVGTVCMSTATLLVLNFLLAARNLASTIDPNLHESWAFGILLHSQGLGKITSIVSFLTFALIAISDYTEDDFLYYLPKELFIGMTTLFFSIVFMALVFITHGYLYLLGQDIGSPLLTTVLLCVATTTYKFLNLPFLRLLFSSAFGRW